MKTITTVGGMLYAIPFVVFGTMHFINAGAMVSMLPAFIPGGVFWIYLTGLGLLAAGASIIIWKYVYLSGILLGIMLLIFVLTIHIPGAMSGDPSIMQMSLGNLLKDMALAGGAFVLAGLYQSGLRD